MSYERESAPAYPRCQHSNPVAFLGHGRELAPLLRPGDLTCPEGVRDPLVVDIGYGISRTVGIRMQHYASCWVEKPRSCRWSDGLIRAPRQRPASRLSWAMQRDSPRARAGPALRCPLQTTCARSFASGGKAVLFLSVDALRGHESVCAAGVEHSTRALVRLARHVGGAGRHESARRESAGGHGTGSHLGL